MNTSKQRRLEMAQLVSKFSAMGINIFPTELITDFCPKPLKGLEMKDWINSARNVWHLRNSDPEIIKAFFKAYDKVENEH